MKKPDLEYSLIHAVAFNSLEISISFYLQECHARHHCLSGFFVGGGGRLCQEVPSQTELDAQNEGNPPGRAGDAFPKHTLESRSEETPVSKTND